MIMEKKAKGLAHVSAYFSAGEGYRRKGDELRDKGKIADSERAYTMAVGYYNMSLLAYPDNHSAIASAIASALCELAGRGWDYVCSELKGLRGAGNSV